MEAAEQQLETGSPDSGLCARLREVSLSQTQTPPGSPDQASHTRLCSPPPRPERAAGFGCSPTAIFLLATLDFLGFAIDTKGWAKSHSVFTTAP